MDNATDSNGNRITRSVERNQRGQWISCVWFGHKPATNIRFYAYRTRAQARNSDISDDIGKRGRVA